jgi:DNA repair protein RadC
MESAILDIPIASSPQAVVIVMHEEATETRERLWVLHLDEGNQLLHKERVLDAAVNLPLVRPREILRQAVTNGAAKIITVRVPSNGTAELALEDVQLWRTLELACDSLGIGLLDHLVVSASGKHVSCRQTIRAPFRREADGYKTKQGR